MVEEEEGGKRGGEKKRGIRKAILFISRAKNVQEGRRGFAGDRGDRRGNKGRFAVVVKEIS